MLEKNDQTLTTLREQNLAVITHRGKLSCIELPGHYAQRSVEVFFANHQIEALILQQTHQWPGANCPWREGEWCIALPVAKRKIWQTLFSQILRGLTFEFEHKLYVGFIFRRNTIEIQSKYACLLQQALEVVKPDIFDENGLPMTWVMPQSPTERLRDLTPHDGNEHDAEQIEDISLLPPLPPQHGQSRVTAVNTDQVIRESFERLRKHLAYREFEFVIRRMETNRRGFVAGRVWFDLRGNPLRMLLSVCPNSDSAEIAATIIHEYAHIVCNHRQHDLSFKRTTIELAEAIYGASYFAEASQRMAESYHIVDLWIAASIRAAMRGEAPPIAKAKDEQLTAHIISRIQKLYALAADQPGTPEAITATGIANTLVTVHELGDYHIRLDSGIDEQMLDRWIDVGKRLPWRRVLASHIAEYCNVFSLTRPALGWIHLFGKYRDIIATEYLYGVCLDSIERQAEQHIQQWRTQREGQITPAQIRSERVSFCESAVRALCDKMREIRRHESQSALHDPSATSSQAYTITSHDLQHAEDFALNEHQKRGMSWVSGRNRSIRHNQSGYDAGQNIGLHDGISPPKNIKGLLT